MATKSCRVRIAILAVGMVVFGVLSSIAFAGGPIAIKGVILDTESNPLVGASVSVVAEGSESPLTTHSKKKGKFVIQLPDSDLVYDVTFEMEGYAFATTKLRPNPEHNPPLTVTLVPADQPQPQTPTAPAGEPSEPESGEPVPEISEAREAAALIYNEGVDALEAEDLPTALEKFKQASELDPEFEDGLNAISVVAFKLEDFAAAANAAESLIQFQPDNLNAKSIAYYSELMLRDFERAIPAARRLAEAKPEVVTDQMAQHAQVMFDEFEYAGCRALLEIIIDTAPDFAPAYFRLGLTCNALQDAACAVPAFEKFLELAPDDPEAATAQSLLDYLR